MVAANDAVLPVRSAKPLYRVASHSTLGFVTVFSFRTQAGRLTLTKKVSFCEYGGFSNIPIGLGSAFRKERKAAGAPGILKQIAAVVTPDPRGHLIGMVGRKHT